jgi:hypothetical protein
MPRFSAPERGSPDLRSIAFASIAAVCILAGAVCAIMALNLMMGAGI